MELIIFIIGIGLCFILNVLAVAWVSQTVEEAIDVVREEHTKTRKEIQQEHKKTRKESQEVKTRLTQVRKDLNVIERKRPAPPSKRYGSELRFG